MMIKVYHIIIFFTSALYLFCSYVYQVVIRINTCSCLRSLLWTPYIVIIDLPGSKIYVFPGRLSISTPDHPKLPIIIKYKKYIK